VAAEQFSAVIIGSGFGGSIMSMVLRRLGKSVLMVEHGKHPRFAIGESSTPFANLLLEKLANDFDLPFLRNLSEWGSWQRMHPEIACGLKRGFTFFHHRFGEPADLTDRAKQLLVAASPNDDIADTHWYRPDFDHFLVHKAKELGVRYVDQAQLEFLSENNGEWIISLSREGTLREIRAEFVIDASGPHSLLAHYLQIPRQSFSMMPRTAGVWAHFRNVLRTDQLLESGTVPVPPYPIDDAAVHHIFPGGWIWMLRFNNGITSAGAAFDRASDIVGTSAEETWGNLLRKLPSVGALFNNSARVTPFFQASELSFRRASITGYGWAMLPSAAGFVDPLLSTGFALNLLGIVRLAEHCRSGWISLERYRKQTFSELEAAVDLISALYAKMESPEEFNRLTLLYFAALSFTETAWRLGKAEMASEFLLSNNHQFTTRRTLLCAAARSGNTVSQQAIEEAIEPFDIAGLSDLSRCNWYPVNLNDLAGNIHKLHATRQDLMALFKKMKLPWPE
jgi:FADH2 O2-dependent halogenase